MENGDQENIQNLTARTERRYEIYLRPQVFRYFAESLRPVYVRELDEIRKDGSFRDISSFHKESRLSRIMTSMLDQYPNPNTLPEKPVMSLSNQDIEFLEKTISIPISAQDLLLRREMMRELKEKFDSEKRKNSPGAFSRIKKIFKP